VVSVPAAAFCSITIFLPLSSALLVFELNTTPLAKVTAEAAPLILVFTVVIGDADPVAAALDAWTVALESTSATLAESTLRVDNAPAAIPAIPFLSVVLPKSVETTAAVIPFRSFWVLNSVVFPIRLISEDS